MGRIMTYKKIQGAGYVVHTFTSEWHVIHSGIERNIQIHHIIIMVSVIYGRDLAA